MDITEINETDPTKLLVEIDKIIRPSKQELDQLTSAPRLSLLVSYYGKLTHAAEQLAVSFEPLKPPDGTNSDGLTRFFDAIVEEMDKKKIDILIENSNRQKGVALDQTWRDKIHSYVAHIRKIVNSEKNIPPKIRETILSRLAAFDAEVDRARTRVQVFTDVFVSLCEGLSAGAEKLTPAVRLGERIIGALVRLQGQPPILSLPPPDQFHLPSPEGLEVSPNPPERT